MDTCGPFPILTPQKTAYFWTILDDASNFGHTSLLTAKSDAFPAYHAVEASWELKSGCWVHVIHCDGVKKLIEGDFGNYLTVHSITQQITVPYAHSQNGKAEHYICTLEHCTQTLLADSSLPPLFEVMLFSPYKICKINFLWLHFLMMSLHMNIWRSWSQTCPTFMYGGASVLSIFLWSCTLRVVHAVLKQFLLVMKRTKLGGEFKIWMESIIFPMMLSLTSYNWVILALLNPYLILQSQLKLLFLNLHWDIHRTAAGQAYDEDLAHHKKCLLVLQSTCGPGDVSHVLLGDFISFISIQDFICQLEFECL